MNSRGLSQQLVMTLRLYFRNTMALVYGYAFPVIFLVAFWVLYRYDRVPLVRHMGELLTIAVLGGACFGLPTALVSDRERGVWRRYRLTPMSTFGLVTSTVVARYGILLSAGLLQIALAMLLGMPPPRHPIDLFVAFSFVAFAFLGVGLVLAMLADNVPAVQALGQCIFLPMLIIGGIAVRLEALPEWAQHLSAFFPGRYAVEVIQASVTGAGLGGGAFNLMALTLIGAAGCLAAAKMFRWDSSQRFIRAEGKAWLGVALAAWIAVGVMAERRGGVVARMQTGTDNASVNPADFILASPRPPERTDAAASPATGQGPAQAPAQASASQPGEQPGRGAASAPSAPVAQAAQAGPAAGTKVPLPPPASSPAAPLSAAGATASGAPAGVSGTGPTAAAAGPSRTATFPKDPEPATIGPPRWQDVTLEIIEKEILFNRLPPDSGVVTPIASSLQEPDGGLYDELDTLAGALPTWAPGLVEDPVQKVRNLLFVAAVPDVHQMASEAYIPAIVFNQIQQVVPKETLIKVLFWIAVHPDEGDDSAVDNLQPLGLGNGPADIREARGRAAVYAVKLLGRLTGKRPAQ
jgi:hypothetical protein